MSSARREFRVIRLCQKLCMDITEMQGTSDKKYRQTICHDLRKRSEQVIHLVRKANDLPAGTSKRIELQKQADELLEEIKDLLWIAGKLLNTGVQKEAQVELSIENAQKPLRNWMEKDQKVALSMCENRMKKASWSMYTAQKTYDLVNEYSQNHKNEKVATALEQSKSRYRIAYDEYRSQIIEYDFLMKQLLKTQEHFHKDDSVLGEVLREIEKATGKTVIHYDSEGFLTTDAISEKKEVVVNANRKIADSESNILSKMMIERLIK